MITQKVKNEVEAFAGSSTDFTIKASGKAFKVLIDGLYTDKIQSITREIWSNALDSHIMAGNPEEPFEVYFPDAFEPTFRVRDFGVGLTHEQVIGLYTTLFESTKEDTNTQVGKFGIGSKSPFAYTDTFTVVSIKDGEKNFYSAIFDGDKAPSVYHLSSEKTTERNGVEVSFPVEKVDLVSFQNAARRVAIGFDVKPKVTNIRDFEWSGIDKVLGSGVYVRMGCVIYPVAYNLVIDYSAKHKSAIPSEFFGRYVQTGVHIIEVNMGEVEMSASRETLSYGRNEPTLETLHRYFNEQYNKIKIIVETFINDNAKSLFQAKSAISFGVNGNQNYLHNLFPTVSIDDIRIFSKWAAFFSSANNMRIDFNGEKLEVKNYNNSRSYYYSTSCSVDIIPTIVKRAASDNEKNEYDVEYSYNFGAVLNGNRRLPQPIPLSVVNMNYCIFHRFLIRVTDFGGFSETKNRRDASRRFEVYSKKPLPPYIYPNNNLHYIELNQENLDKFKKKFDNKGMIEGVDYQFIMLDEIEMPAVERAKAVPKSVTERVRSLPRLYVYNKDCGSYLAEISGSNLVDGIEKNNSIYGVNIKDKTVIVFPVAANSSENVFVNADVSKRRVHNMGNSENFIHRWIGAYATMRDAIVVRVPKSSFKIITDAYPDWEVFDESEVDDLIEQEISRYEKECSKKLITEINSFNIISRETRERVDFIKKGVDKNGVFGVYLESLKDGSASRQILLNEFIEDFKFHPEYNESKYDTFRTRIEKADSDRINKSDSSEQVKEILNKAYPMFMYFKNYFSYYVDAESIETLVDYIKMVDKQNEVKV